MTSQESKLEASDAELVARAQSGDSRAFGELWRRHYRSAARVARQFTSSIDADDLVSEAYARIYQRVLAGGGPTSGAFRPYLYTTIRNLASSWGAASRDIAVDEIEEFEDERIPDDPAAWALDRTLTARAFRSLPERWQTVLWYTEVEGMDPHEVAPILGMTANGVAALSYRAREGLRTAWLQAHVSDATSAGECRWAIERLGGHARRSLTDRERTRLETHLAGCAKCSIIAEEVDEVGSHLAMILVPALLGGIAGGALLTQLAAPSAAMAAEAVPALPAAVAALGSGAAGAGIASGAGVAAGTGAAASAGIGVPSLVGGLAVVAVIGGSVALGGAQAPAGADAVPKPTVSAVASASATPPPSLLPVSVGTGAATSPPASPDPSATDSAGGLGGAVGGVGSAVGGTVGAVTGAVGDTVGGVTGAVGGAVGAVGGSVTPTSAPSGQAAPPGAPATVALDLHGKGTPGATVAAQAAGTVWATTTVAANGTWSIHIDALPSTAGSVTLTQDVRGLLSSVLALIGITQLSVDTNSLGIPLTLNLLK